MSSDTVISVENVSKQYRLGEVGTGSLAHDVNRFWHKLRGKEDPYLKIGEVNDRTKKAGSNQSSEDSHQPANGQLKTARSAAAAASYAWALRDVSFEVRQGEVLGIIGRNGAGKSTLLKILSRVTTPTTGEVKVKGRIASLLEVGTGFHPELTGRENIYINGAILGMRKHEITRKLDEIIEFSGVERYIDTPVKRYSSGMYVRLAFAVAAHLDSEVLVLDEVLAVGDAEFQKKCLGKMKDVAGHGRTVLFVSHNESAIKRLCSHAILLENGNLTFSGTPEDTFKKYKEGRQSCGFSDQKRIHRSVHVRIINAQLHDNGVIESAFMSGIQPRLEVFVSVLDAITFSFETILRDAHSNPVMFAPLGLAQGFRRHFEPGTYKLCLGLQLPVLAEGRYSLDLIIGEPGQSAFEYLEEALVFTILPSNNQITGWVFQQSRGQGCALLETTSVEVHPIGS